jgi:hypothetical protein
MTAEADNLILEHLRPMRGQLDRLDARVTSIEQCLDLVEG